ncbi:MAG TPA: YdeI/OmpD-associated family protein [Gaiellaceae bacterium]|nr:YdeI/OmpD-associated family protein [Gaiellaceae bacterium]
MEPVFFASPSEFRTWLAEHHDRADELWVGFHKKATGRPSMTWPESVDEALCFGWIDAVRKSLGPDAYAIRFTPRKVRSTWSAVNIARVQELIAEGRMQPAGLRAFEARTDDRSAIYAYEQRHGAKLAPEDERQFRSEERAWSFFQAQPPSYRKTAIWWVASAKRDETRRRRLRTLIEDSAKGVRIRQLRRREAGG